MNLYSNIVLTVIAGLLAVIAFRPADAPVPQMVQAPLPRVIDVNIVGASKILPVDFEPLRERPLAVNFSGRTLPVSFGEDPLRVTLANTAPLPVSIADTLREIPVVMKEDRKQKEPLAVKLVGVERDVPVFVRTGSLPVKVLNPPPPAASTVPAGVLDVNISQINGYPVYGFPNYPLPVKMER